MTDTSTKLRIGIVGAGYVSRHHISALKTLDFVDIVGIVDLDLPAAQQVAQQFALPLAGGRLADLAAAKPQVIYVLTSPSSHCALALEAMDMGCHVFVEKPMAESPADCDAMIAKAAQCNLRLSVNHSDRLDPIVLEALDKVRSGVCGDLIAVDFIRSSEYAPFAGGPRAGAHRKGSYPFQDIGVHGLYLLEAFLGPIRKLRVDYRSIVGDSPLFDDWHATAECERGVGRLHLSWVSRPMQSRLLIQGTRGYIEVDRFLQTLTVNRQLPGPKFIGMVLNAFFGSLGRAMRVVRSVFRFALKRLPPSPGIYAGAIDFAQAVQQRRAPLVPAEEGRRIVQHMSEISALADQDAEQVFASRKSDLAPADVLVTGAAGFLGSALTRRLLNQGKTVRVLVRRASAAITALGPVQVVIGDLGDPDIVDHAVRGVRVIYHVGAAMRGSPEQFRSGTTVGVRNVIESSLRYGIERLVYVSSLSVMDHAGRPEKQVLKEDSAYEPYPERRGLYTQTKLDAEQAIHAAIANRGLPAVIVRPGQIFGVGAERVPPNGVIALAGRWILVGNGKSSLPLVYLDDVVDALLLAGERPDIAGKTFNVVDTALVTQTEYLAACQARLGASLKLKRVPTWIMFRLGHAIEMVGKALRRELPLSRYRVRSLRPLANFDDSAARLVLGWQPRVGVREGLRRTFVVTDGPSGT